MSNLKVETWHIDWLATPYYGFASAEGKKALVLPRYQRSYVWDEERRRSLVESINKEFPIGALIVRKTNEVEELKDKNGNSVECTVYEVIDGLQRSTSLIFHQLHPLKIVSGAMVSRVAQVGGVDLQTIAEVASEVTKDRVSEESLNLSIAKWAQSCTKEQYFDSGDGAASQRYFLEIFEPTEFWTNGLISYLSLYYGADNNQLLALLNQKGLTDSLNSLLHKLQAETAVAGYPLPVVIWDGPAEDAAEIFYRVNQGGVKLSKYQVMAAAWAQNFTDIASGSVAEESKRILTPSAGAVVIKKTTSGVENLDLYECLVGMSALLEKNHPELFKPSAKNSDGDSINALESSATPYVAFNIAALICKTKLGDMKTLPKNLQHCDFLKGEDGVPSIAKLWSAIRDAAAIVSESLIALKFAVKGTSPIAHAEQPMAAMIASVALQILLNNSASQNAVKASALKNLPAHYLADALGGITSSHGTDAAAFSRVWTAPDQVTGNAAVSPSAYEFNPYYSDPVKKDNLSNALDQFWREQGTRTVSTSSKGRPTVDAKQKLVLRYLVYKKANWHTIEQAEAMHIDHSIPFAVLKRWSEKNNGKEYLGGTIANLAIIPSKINLSKNESNLEEWLATRNTGKNAVDADIVWTLVPYGRGDLSFSTDKLLSTTAEEFNKTMDAIWSRMKKQILSESAVQG
jgi:Protein of unknown function DUF262